jgi:hypothetical protein
MIEVLGENYYIDLDEIEKYIDMSDKFGDEEDKSEDSSPVSSSEMKINIVKFELVKMLIDVILSEEENYDDNLIKKSKTTSTIPFRLAFNSLLNKKLINHY